jgi:SpoIID/LytB domain protein
MAESGASFTQILTRYYSSITIASRGGEDIRALVEESDDVIVTSSQPFVVSWSDGAPLATTDGTWRFWRARYAGSGIISVDKASSPGGPWTGAGGSSTTYPVFTPGAGLLEVVQGDGSVRIYRGRILARYSPSAPMRAINELALDDYLAGVVPREMPASWPGEALKAQAVAARTYAAYKKDDARSKGTMFDICATTTCQVYGGFGSRSAPDGAVSKVEHSATSGAISATAGNMLLSGGAPILAEYSSSTGGHTAPGTVSYLKAVSDPTDSISPHHNWTATIKASEIEAAWPQIGRLVSIAATKRNGYGDWGGRVLEMRIAGTSSAVTVSGDTFRSTFSYPGRASGVRSNWFALPGANGDGVGAVRGNVWYFRTAAGATTSAAFGRSTDLQLAGDWDGDGRDTPAIVRGNVWYLNNGFDGAADTSIAYGRAGDIPVAGDWDGDGRDTPAIVRGNVWHINNGLDGAADISLAYGRAGDIPVAGDWDGDGRDTPGIVRGGVWYINNGFDGAADVSLTYGRASDRPLAGDWDGDGRDTPGIRRDNAYYLNNALDGAADTAFAFGWGSDRPIAGDWDGN